MSQVVTDYAMRESGARRARQSTAPANQASIFIKSAVWLLSRTPADADADYAMKFLRRTSAEPPQPDYDLDELREIAAQGRKLAIFDRATGLYAYWYLQLRAEEEISRSKRHDKSLICVSVWAPSEPMIDALRTRLQAGLRDHDLAAYLSNGHFVALLTETHMAGAGLVVGRILSGLDADVTAGMARYPTDGTTFDELLEFAKVQASQAERSA